MRIRPELPARLLRPGRRPRFPEAGLPGRSPNRQPHHSAPPTTAPAHGAQPSGAGQGNLVRKDGSNLCILHFVRYSCTSSGPRCSRDSQGCQARHSVPVQGSTVSQPGKCLRLRVATFKPMLRAIAPINESSLKAASADLLLGVIRLFQAQSALRQSAEVLGQAQLRTGPFPALPRRANRFHRDDPPPPFLGFNHVFLAFPGAPDADAALRASSHQSRHVGNFPPWAAVVKTSLSPCPPFRGKRVSVLPPEITGKIPVRLQASTRFSLGFPPRGSLPILAIRAAWPPEAPYRGETSPLASCGVL